MTELKCPTCGCTMVTCVFDMKSCVNPAHVTAIPHPDLTKLREAYITYMEAQTGTMEMVDRIFRAIEEILECKD